MKTKLKTQEAIALFNPFEGITFNGMAIKPYLEEIRLFVEQPDTQNILNPRTFPDNEFERHAALYILNSLEPSIIKADFDKEQPIDNGIFEYIKAIYSKTPYIYLDLADTENNNVLIKSKKLKELDSNESKLEEAVDTNYSIHDLFNSSQIIQLETNEHSNLNIWTAQTNEKIFNSPGWALSEIKDLIEETSKKEYKDRDKFFNTTLSSLFEKLSDNLKVNDDFLISLLKIDNKNLNTFLISNTKHNILDFSKDNYFDLLISFAKKDEFSLISKIFEGLNPANTEIIEKFKILVNMPESIEYFKNQYISTSSIFTSRPFEDFNIIFTYTFLNETNQLNPEIVDKYLTSITSTRMSNDTYMSESDIFKLHPSLLNQKPILDKIINHVNIKELQAFYTEHKIENILIADKSFLLNNRDIRFHKIATIIDSFHKDHKSGNNKKYVTDLLNLHPKLYNFLYEKNLYPNELKDIDIISGVVNNGEDIRKIPSAIMTPHLIKNHDNFLHEKLKLSYMVENNLIEKHYLSPEEYTKEERDFVSKKYKKIEYMFFLREFNYEIKAARSLLGKIKSPEQVKTLFDNMHNHRYEINYNDFYKALHPDLQKDVNFLNSINIVQFLKASSLHPTLKYNKKIMLHFLDNDNIKHVPEAYLNDKTFALKMAQNLEDRNLSIDKTPLYIQKLFKFQEVNGDYFEFLTKYINMIQIMVNINVAVDKNKTENNDKPEPTKKLKI